MENFAQEYEIIITIVFKNMKEYNIAFKRFVNANHIKA